MVDRLLDASAIGATGALRRAGRKRSGSPRRARTTSWRSASVNSLLHGTARGRTVPCSCMHEAQGRRSPTCWVGAIASSANSAAAGWRACTWRTTRGIPPRRGEGDQALRSPPRSGRERFLREIGIAARLRHPNIMPLNDSGDVDGLLYFVMPYEEGKSLRARLDSEPTARRCRGRGHPPRHRACTGLSRTSRALFTAI